MLIDSNILIYAINADSAKHESAKQFLKDNLGNLQVAQQNLLETLRVVTHKAFASTLNLKEAVEAIFLLIQGFQIVVPHNNTYYLCLELIKEHNLTGNRIFDAYLAATALTNGIYEVATDNERDFRKYREIKVINPFKSDKKES